MFKWVESLESMTVVMSELPAMQRMCGLKNVPVTLGNHLWAYLSMNLVGDAKQVFDNTESPNGFEVWRRLVTHVHAQTVRARMDKCHQVLNPPRIQRE